MPKKFPPLKEQLDAAGVEAHLAYPNDGRTQVEQQAAIVAFVQKHLMNGKK